MTAPLIQNLIVFTDLDGTLLDHATYSHAEAASALDQLRALGIPLILASSKTAAEITPLREQLGFSHCEAIVENGSGILQPHEDGSQSGGTYQLLRHTLDGIPAPLRRQYQGFGDWSVEEISGRTGLVLEDAANAKTRRFSEPGLWLGSDEEREDFVSTARAAGLTVQQGGRFLTLSFGGSKAQRMMEITKRYANVGKCPFVVALGDAQNDVAMIEQADLGVIIPNPSHQELPPLDGEAAGQIIRARIPGPPGWNQVITSLLEKAERK